MIVLVPKYGLPENATIEIRNGILYLVVSLNITPSMIQYQNPNRIQRGNVLWTYSMEQQLFHLKESYILLIYKRLLNKVMIHCRMAKQRVLQEEIIQLTLNL